jgi:hypothetical protein
MSNETEVPAEDPRGDLSPEAWTIYVDLALKYREFESSEGAAKESERRMNALEGKDFGEVAFSVLMDKADLAAQAALRAVAAHLAERSGS